MRSREFECEGVKEVELVFAGFGDVIGEGRGDCGWGNVLLL